MQACSLNRDSQPSYHNVYMFLLDVGQCCSTFPSDIIISAFCVAIITTNVYDSKALRPAHDAVQEHNYFRRKLRWVSDERHLNAEIPNTKITVERQIRQYEQESESYDKLRKQAADDITEATDLHGLYQKDRTTGGKKIGRSAQHFVKCFADFLNVYSGIVELLKGAGDIYGSVAYETLSIFFIVRCLSGFASSPQC